KGVIAMNEGTRESVSRQKCREIMTAELRTATTDATVAEVAAMMRDGDIGAVPVVDAGKLVGIVTDRDIVVRVVADNKGSETRVADAMTTDLHTVAPDDFVFEAVRLMGERQVRRVPVVNDDGSLAGIIAMADVALEMEDQQEIAETIEEISSGPGFWQR